MWCFGRRCRIFQWATLAVLRPLRGPKDVIRVFTFRVASPAGGTRGSFLVAFDPPSLASIAATPRLGVMASFWHAQVMTILCFYVTKTTSMRVGFIANDPSGR